VAELIRFDGKELVRRIPGMAEQAVAIGSVIDREENHFLVQLPVVALLAGDGAWKRGGVSRVDGGAERDMACGALHRVFHGNVYVGINSFGTLLLRAFMAARAIHLLNLGKTIQLILIGFGEGGFRLSGHQGFQLILLLRSECTVIPVLAVGGAQLYRLHILWKLSPGDFIHFQDVRMAAKAFVARHRRGLLGAHIRRERHILEKEAEGFDRFVPCPAIPLLRWHATQEREMLEWALIEESYREFTGRSMWHFRQ
jgi:hypothetical protein